MTRNGCLSLATRVRDGLTEDALAILSVAHAEGIHLHRGPCGFHTRVGGAESFLKLDPDPLAPYSLEPLSTSDTEMRQFLQWSRRGETEEEEGCYMDAEEASQDDITTPDFAFYVWILSFFFGTVLHLTDQKVLELSTPREVTVLMFAHNHRQWDTLHAAGCDAIGAMKGVDPLESWTTSAIGEDVPPSGQCLLVFSTLVDVHYYFLYVRCRSLDSEEETHIHKPPRGAPAWQHDSIRQRQTTAHVDESH